MHVYALFSDDGVLGLESVHLTLKAAQQVYVDNDVDCWKPLISTVGAWRNEALGLYVIRVPIFGVDELIPLAYPAPDRNVKLYPRTNTRRHK